MPQEKPKIKILTGSVRPTRFNIQPAEWIHELAKARSYMEVELIDLKDVNLPFLDEPKSPKQREYEKDYTKAWSKRIDESDGFIFVTPEYNHGISPVLKNAVDYLFWEWNHKPVAFVSYGSLAGGTRAVEHWRGISAELSMYDLREQIMLPDYWNHQDANGKYEFDAAQTKLANDLLASLAFWATMMKEARAKLASA